MRFIYISLLLGLIFVGCGYKSSPIYVDNDKKIEKVAK